MTRDAPSPDAPQPSTSRRRLSAIATVAAVLLLVGVGGLTAGTLRGSTSWPFSAPAEPEPVPCCLPPKVCCTPPVPTLEPLVEHVGRVERGVLITRTGRVFDTAPPSLAESSFAADVTLDPGGSGLVVRTHEAPWPEATTPTAEQCSSVLYRWTSVGHLDTVDVGEAFCFTTTRGGTAFARVTSVDGSGVLVDAVIWDAAR